MLIGYKYRIYPNSKQKEIFAKTFGCVRFVYNKMLDDKIEHYKNTQQTLNVTPAKYKDEFPWLKEVDSLALCNAQLNLQSAYNNFFRTKKGFPKFKSKRNKQSYITNNQGNNIRIEKKKIKLPKVGFIKMKQHREFTGTVKSVTVSKDITNKYFVSVLVDTDYKSTVKETKNKIGLDLGVKNIVVDSNGNKIENPKLLQKHEKNIKTKQKTLSRKKKGSNNYEKTRVKLAKCYEKLTNSRKDFLHKLSYTIINENQIIIVEDLSVKSMIENSNNSNVTKSIADVSFSELVRQLEYKAKWNNRVLVKIDKYFPSSQTCNNCGFINKEVRDLSVRTWKCPSCNVVHDRDVNAAKNILREGIIKINKTAGTAGLACVNLSIKDIEQEAHQDLACG